jgi:hypothetical protein
LPALRKLNLTRLFCIPTCLSLSLFLLSLSIQVLGHEKWPQQILDRVLSFLALLVRVSENSTSFLHPFSDSQGM